MANLKEQEKWEEGVYQIEENDPVLGGENGITNKPIKQLANRTLWLKKALELFGKKSVPKDLTAESTSTADESGHTHKLPLASVTAKGVVKLNSQTASDSEQDAATPKAVKMAYDKAVEAKTAADSAQGSANDGINRANNAQSAANAAQHTANDGVSKADAAQRTANDGVSKANAAQTSANQAKSAANAAQHTANDGVSKADAAQRTANDGVSKANAAQTSANQAKSAANAAQHTANDGVSKADAAQRTANDGVSKANAAQTSANQAKSAADAAQSSANAANNNANGRISKTDISHATNGTNKAKVASEFALNELNKKLSTVIRKNYTKTIKGTNASFDNATQKNINLEGETIIHPDGKIEQIIHFKAFRVWWFYFEAKNNSERLAIEIPVPLWTAMPNKITNVTATFSRTESGRSFSFGSEAFEWWPPSWAFERQNNIKDRLWLYTIRHVGNQDEHIDLWVKVEGY